MKDKKVLLIGSKEDSWDNLSKEMEKLGYKVLKVADGFDSYRIVEKEIPALIIIEVVPPKIVGFSICKLVKLRPMLSHIPVIIVVSSVDANLENLAAKSEANAIIPMKDEPSEMLDEIRKHAGV